MKQIDKKRWVNIPTKGRTRLYSRKININGREDLNVAKVKYGDLWYVFDINTEDVVAQGYKWFDVLKILKNDYY